MTLLLTGVTGTLGSDLKKLFPDAISPPHSEFDICDKPKVDEFFKNNHIDLVIHTAALTTVRGCEKDKTLATKINVEGTKNLVDGLFHSNPDGYFVYISTACVFDGWSGMRNEDELKQNIEATQWQLEEEIILKIGQIFKEEHCPTFFDYPMALND